MYRHKIETIDTKVQKVYFFENSVLLSFDKVLTLWQKSEDFRYFYISILQKIPYEAFFWELPPITKQNVKQKTFEFVAIDNSHLANVSPTPHSFQKHFQTANEDVIDFYNLGKDALLVVPCPLEDYSIYTHIGSFVRNVSCEQNHTLWKKVAECVRKKLSSKKLWLNTSGLGVFWLHIRLDSSPKYYKYAPYRQE